MLVLSRKSGQSLFIGDVKVTVVKLDRNRVKIGIDAPEHVQVIREELLARVASPSSSHPLTESPESASLELELESC